MNQPALIFVDLFCGAGGTTTGIEHAKSFDKKVGKVVACVNHDANAIASHEQNHPDCIHFTEDIRTVDLTELGTVIRRSRIMNPGAKLALWASLECTEYSKAKGGLAKDADSRTLAWYLPRYLDAADIFAGGYDYIFIENVVEFMTGGPMRIKPKQFLSDRTELKLIRDKKTGEWKYGWEPIPETKGVYYQQWIELIKSYGYNFEYRILNAADYGGHTSRRRYFGVFAKVGLPIEFPKPTYFKKPKEGQNKWKAVKEVLDFTDEGQSIFERKTPLATRTMERIYAGLVKYVANGDTSFIQKYYSGRPKGKVNSTDDPCPTLTTINGLTLVQPSFLLKYNSTNKKTGKHIPPSIDEPSPALSTQDRIGLVNAQFLALNYSSGGQLGSINEPCPTLSTKDRVSIVNPQFWIDRQFGQGGGKNSSVEEPIGALPTTPKANLVSAWLLSPHYTNTGSSVDDPMPTITANRKHHCLMFPQYGINCSHSIDSPSPTLIASMHKTAPQLIVAEGTDIPIAIAIYEDDDEIVKQIKMFMAAFNIFDIKMRMLRIPELKKITGFSPDYVLIGNQADQKKYIGNAVPVQLAQAIIESIGNTLLAPIKKAA